MIKSFNMATMPQRITTAIDTIKSVYDQADIIRLYLNNFTEMPPEFIDDKIIVYQGDDLRSTGKLFWTKNPDEYYFSIDDDLIYPPTYAEDMINGLNKYDDNVLVSLHGKRLKQGKKRSYFRDLTLDLHCLKDVHQDTKVHVIGNGVSLFNTNKISIDYSVFKYNFMDDILISIQAQEQGKGAIVLKHSEGYIKYNQPHGKTLHSQYVNNDSKQTEMVNSVDWKLI